MFLFIGAVFAAVVPFGASSAVSFSVPTFAPRSEALCASRGNSTAPKPSSNSLSGFMEDTKYEQLASTAPIPTGYALAMSNANCAFSSTRYMLYVQLDSYDPETCAELCNKHEGCDSCKLHLLTAHFHVALLIFILPCSQHLYPARPVTNPRTRLPQPNSYRGHQMCPLL